MAAEEKSSLILHAERELKLAGLDQPDADYGGMLAPAVMELITTFSDQGHSGQSAMIVATLFARLVQWRPLSPLTDDPAEWQEVSKEMLTKAEIKDGKKIWQSVRSPACFSKDGGKTYKDSEENQFYTSIDHKEAQREREEVKQAKPENPEGSGGDPGQAETEAGQEVRSESLSQPGTPAGGSEAGQSAPVEGSQFPVRGAKPTDHAHKRRDKKNKNRRPQSGEAGSKGSA